MSSVVIRGIGGGFGLGIDVIALCRVIDDDLVVSLLLIIAGEEAECSLGREMTAGFLGVYIGATIALWVVDEATVFRIDSFVLVTVSVRRVFGLREAAAV